MNAKDAEKLAATKQGILKRLFLSPWRQVRLRHAVEKLEPAPNLGGERGRIIPLHGQAAAPLGAIE
jgi:hypothetical protein